MMLKKIVFIILVSSKLFGCYGQDSIQFMHEGIFEYALVSGSEVYIPIRPSLTGKVHIIWKKKMYVESPVYLHLCSAPENPNFGFAWSKSGDTIFNLDFWRSNSGRSSYINYRQFESKDSLELTYLPRDLEIKKNTFLLIPLLHYFKSFGKLRYKLNREELIDIDNTLNFDIYAPNDKKLEFYLRDKEAFYIWECDVPDKGIVANWHQVSVYGLKDWDVNYPPRKYSESYSSEKVKLNSIPDSLFLQGHFKVVVQGKNKFIVNREHALIYYMNDKEIVKVGGIDVSKDYPTIRGKKLFVEDRDNKEIIFFAPVIWEKNKYPKPKVRVMSEAEMKEKFKYVLK